MRSLRRSIVIAAVAVVAATSWIAAQERDSEPPPWLGVYLGQTPRFEVEEDDSASRPGGVSITAVVEESPADEAGLRARDRVLAVEGIPVFTPNELVARIQEVESGDWVTLSIQRGKLEKDFTARLVDKPDGKKMKIRQGWIGAQTIDLPPTLREHFGAPAESGVMVYRVYEGSPAASAGIEIGDVIYSVDEEPVLSRGLFARRVSTGGVGNKVEIKLSRYGAEITVEALIETRPDEMIEREQRARAEGRARSREQKPPESEEKLEKPKR